MSTSALDSMCLFDAVIQDGWTPLHWAASQSLLQMTTTQLHESSMCLSSLSPAEWGKADVVYWMLRMNPQLLKIKDKSGMTPLDDALGRHPSAVVAMAAVAGDVAMELLDRGVKMGVKAQGLNKVVPVAKGFLKEHSDSLGLDSLRLCAVFRKLMKLRPKDSVTDDLANVSNWQEALTANFCSDTSEYRFEESLAGKEREWFAALESAEPLTVVTQANCINLVTKHWKKNYEGWRVKLSPRDVFISRVLSMLLMVAFVLLHIESIKGDSDVMLPGVWPLVWLWGSVLTGAGFMTQKSSKASV